MRLFTSFAALAVTIAIPAHAQVADPDAFASGTNISNSFSGLTMLTVRTGSDVNDVLSTSSVFAVTDPNASTGSLAFGQTNSDSTWGNGSFEYLLGTFSTPVNIVSLDFFANDFTDTNAALSAFDSFGTQIDLDSAALVSMGNPVTLTVTGPSIKFFRAYWDETNRIENGGLDNLVYRVGSAVPEPTTWAMFLLGFGLVGGAMR